MNDPTAPLAGVRVIDLTRVLAGPVCGRILADLGADVIKLEPPDGDISRAIAPKSDRGMSGLYTLGNLGKRNVSIDLHAPGAAALVLELIAQADVVLENFRPGVIDRLGLGWSEIQRVQPRAILLSINGYGSQSAWSDRPAYAPMMHALAGVLQWEAQTTGNPVAAMADNKADMSAGMHGAIAVLAALLRVRETGRGQHLEVPLFDALLATYSESAYALLPEPQSRDECMLFEASGNGAFAIAGTPQHAWRVFKTGLGAADPAAAGDDIPTKARLRHRAMEDWMKGQPGPEAVRSALEDLGLAVAPVQSLPEALHGPLARERGLLLQVDDRRGGTRPVVRAPYWLDGQPIPPRGPAPRRGEHNDEVLHEILGHDPQKLKELREAGILVSEPADAR